MFVEFFLLCLLQVKVSKAFLWCLLWCFYLVQYFENPIKIIEAKSGHTWASSCSSVFPCVLLLLKVFTSIILFPHRSVLSHKVKIEHYQLGVDSCGEVCLALIWIKNPNHPLFSKTKRRSNRGTLFACLEVKPSNQEFRLIILLSEQGFHSIKLNHARLSTKK